MARCSGSKKLSGVSAIIAGTDWWHTGPGRKALAHMEQPHEGHVWHMWPSRDRKSVV